MHDDERSLGKLVSRRRYGTDAKEVPRLPVASYPSVIVSSNARFQHPQGRVQASDHSGVQGGARCRSSPPKASSCCPTRPRAIAPNLCATSPPTVFVAAGAACRPSLDCARGLVTLLWQRFLDTVKRKFDAILTLTQSMQILASLKAVRQACI